MAYCDSYKTDYASHLKNAVNFFAARTQKMNFYRCFPVCIRACECRSLIGLIMMSAATNIQLW